jgi:hypothetical protein
MLEDKAQPVTRSNVDGVGGNKCKPCPIGCPYPSLAHTINAVAKLSTSQLKPAFYELISEDAAYGGGLVKS